MSPSPVEINLPFFLSFLFAFHFLLLTGPVDLCLDASTSLCWEDSLFQSLFPLGRFRYSSPFDVSVEQLSLFWDVSLFSQSHSVKDKKKSAAPLTDHEPSLPVQMLNGSDFHVFYSRRLLSPLIVIVKKKQGKRGNVKNKRSWDVVSCFVLRVTAPAVVFFLCDSILVQNLHVDLKSHCCYRPDKTHSSPVLVEKYVAFNMWIKRRIQKIMHCSIVLTKHHWNNLKKNKTTVHYCIK